MSLFLQVAELQKQSSGACGAAPPQGDAPPAAVSSLKHSCSSSQTTAASTEALGKGAASAPESSRDHTTGLCAGDCQRSSVGRAGSARPSTEALNLGYPSEEEKQDQSKDEPLEFGQREGCECKLVECCGAGTG